MLACVADVSDLPRRRTEPDTSPGIGPDVGAFYRCKRRFPSRPCAGKKLPCSMGRHAGGVSEQRNFLEFGFKRFITTDDVANR